MTQTILIEHKEAARPEQCRTCNNRYLLVLANHNILILNKRDQKIEGLEVDPNPSYFLLLYFDPHNFTNCTSTNYVSISILVNYHPLLTVFQGREHSHWLVGRPLSPRTRFICSIDRP